jgi:hypothetical protein
MKRSPLLALFAAASMCVAQSTAAPPAVPGQGSTMSAQEDQRLQAAIAATKAKLEAQIQIMTDRMNQVGCPVTLTSAQLTPYLMLLRASNGSSATEGGLDLQFRNTSGKQIQSMEFQAEFLAKKSMYDLKAVKVDLHLTASGTSSLDKTLDHLRHLPLPQRTNPVVLNSITLEQVTFADGSLWFPAQDNRCGYSPSQAMQVGAR